MAEAPRRAWLIADDYGLSPGVCAGIRTLLAERRLSGTGCMTLFADFQAEAEALKALPGPFQIGLHLTLTDFPALSTGALMKRLPRLLAARGGDGGVAAEADAQLDRFRSAFGADPAFIDGHQHVHFLPSVRRWLAARFADVPAAARPWLRGAPALQALPVGICAKIAVVKLLARGFDAQMRRRGFRVFGPLCGFYDWRRPAGFDRALAGFVDAVPDGGVIMCHPGRVDAVLRRRDGLTRAREEELAVLADAGLPRRLAAAGLALAGDGR